MDTKSLLKSAQKSTPAGEVFSGLPGDMLLSLFPGGHAVNSTAYLAGLLSDEDNRQRDLSGISFVPGMSAFRRGNRIKTQVSRELRDIANDSRYKGARPVAHAVAEHLGPITSALASTGLGAGLGAALSRDKGRGTVVGGALGLGAASLGHVIAAIAAAKSARRTKEEQIEADKGSLAAKYLIPGKGQYGHFKRLGRSQGERDEDPENSKIKSKETQKKAYAMGFAKVAEAGGADPDELYKYAQLWRRAVGGVKRFGNLLMGGNVKTMSKDYANLVQDTANKISEREAADWAFRSGKNKMLDAMTQRRLAHQQAIEARFEEEMAKARPEITRLRAQADKVRRYTRGRQGPELETFQNKSRSLDREADAIRNKIEDRATRSKLSNQTYGNEISTRRRDLAAEMAKREQATQTFKNDLHRQVDSSWSALENERAAVNRARYGAAGAAAGGLLFGAGMYGGMKRRNEARQRYQYQGWPMNRWA